ncbi:MAG: hypothetical protein JWL80_169 [Parcubacteria group bacterium]|nr:hypothetical protein [Parcubacteria group bacterium]
MIFTKEQKKAAYKKLPEEIQDLIMSNDTSEFVSLRLKEVGLSEVEAEEADSQILYAMLGLQNLVDAIRTIAEITKKPLDTYSKLSLDLQAEIFSKIPAEFLITQTVPEKVITIEAPVIAPVTSKEVELPPVILPMIEPGEVVHDTPPQPEVEPVTPIPQIVTPTALPVTPAELKVEFTAHTTPQTVTPVTPPIVPVAPKSIIEEKMSGTISVSTPTSYQAGQDPYREPIQ